MSNLTKQETVIYNDGERLIPGRTHNIEEEIRHRSSYAFFKKIILNDLSSNSTKISILDIGCGTGHGCKTLAEIPNAVIYGVDVSTDAIDYAEKHYKADNINYRIADIQSLINEQTEYDYIVSRHAIEHINDGLHLCLSLKFRRRMIINVPYNEAPGNEFHLIHNITSTSFANYPNQEIYYEDLDGLTVENESHPKINSIICVSSKDGFSQVSKNLVFPISAWIPDEMLVQKYKILELERRLEILEKERVPCLENSLILRIERKLRRIFKNGL